MLTLRFCLTEEEYFNFNYYTAWSAPDKKMYRLRYYAKVFLLYAGIAVLYIVSNRTGMVWVDLSIFGCIGLVYFLLIPFLIRKSVKRRIKDILSQEANAHILEESEIVLSNEGIMDRDKVSETRYDWEAIVKKAETAGSYYLYTNSYHAIVIPKRILSNPGERQQLDNLLNRHLSLSSQFQDR